MHSEMAARLVFSIFPDAGLKACPTSCLSYRAEVLRLPKATREKDPHFSQKTREMGHPGLVIPADMGYPLARRSAG
jgi:hypothetical protein